LDRLFAPYATTKNNGLGLGLAICQVLVQQMGGKLQVTTPSTGGAVFSLLLPHAPLHTA
jgi:C4-dicarboxylate-specific signal transduction histidine kinase